MNPTNNDKKTQLIRKIAEAYAGDKENEWKRLVENLLENRFEQFIGPDSEIEDLAEDMATYADEDLSDMIQDELMSILGERETSELSDILQSFHFMLIKFVKERATFIADRLIDAAKDAAAYNKDPYSYYGVKRSDFF